MTYGAYLAPLPKNDSEVLNKHYLEWAEGIKDMWENLTDFIKVTRRYLELKREVSANRDPETSSLADLEKARKAERKFGIAFGNVYFNAKGKAIRAAKKGDVPEVYRQMRKMDAYRGIFKGETLQQEEVDEVFANLRTE